MAANFSPTSRYAGTPTTTMITAEGTTIIYLLRRFVPSPERFALLQVHLVTQGERLDNITAQYLGDPEQFWRICDANRASLEQDPNQALRPEALETPATLLRITLPEGVPGVSGA